MRFVRSLWLVWLSIGACGKAHSTADGGALDASERADAFVADVGVPDGAPDGGPADAGPDVGLDAGQDGGPPPLRCGGETCAEGERCCFATGACVGEGACEASEGTCASNADCDGGRVCVRDDGACLGEGRCVMPAMGCAPAPACGCDGNTYGSVCDAMARGVRVSGVGRDGACGVPIPPREGMGCANDDDCHGSAWCEVRHGYCVDEHTVVPCGTDADCGDGASCCPRTGTCVADDCVGCCENAPADSLHPCRDDSDCTSLDPASAFCWTEACGASGGCFFQPLSCGGTLAPVCGCDGRTYSNACWARRDRVDVRRSGTCDESL
ncbi:MAG: hypothetical protein H6722_07715 [Sandaracinus sp.]|nr:hypothetical protein [Sandaracinus sp.]